MNHTALYSKRICNHLIQIESSSLKKNLKDIEFHARMFPVGVQPQLIQGIRSGDGVGEDQDTIASIRY